MNGTRGLIIATAAAFIVGCSAGLMGGILFTHFVGPRHGAMFGARPRGGAGFDARRGPWGPGGHERMLSMLEHELNLTPEQREHIVAHLDRARRESAAMRDSMHAWIERELTPEQRERWKQLENRFERSRHGRWPRDAMPPDRP